MIIKKGRQFLELPTLQVFIKNNLPINKPAIIIAPTANELFNFNIDRSTSKPLVITPLLFSILLIIYITITHIAKTKPILSMNGIS